MLYKFLGQPPAYVKQWLIQHLQPSAPTYTSFKVETTSSYKKSGIYSAQRDDTTKSVVIDWGDGTIEEVDGDVSQKVHTYVSVGTFNATIDNVKTFAASIGSSIWYNTTSQNQYTLKEVVIGSSITSIGYQAFCYCSGLTSMMIPSSVTSIGEEAFWNCYSLTSVTIDNGVTSIGSYAFGYCTNLTSVTIPSSVTSIGSGAFSQCGGLTSVTIPDSVTSIGDEAFWNCYSLTSVTIGNGVTSIGAEAFSECSELTSVTMEGKTKAQVQAMNPESWFYSFSYSSMTIHCTDGDLIVTVSCILKGTDILLADGTTKKIENLTYDDVLKVWDFDEGKLSSAKVCWLTRPGLKNNHYYQLTFDNGTVLKTTGINSNHRIFSVDKNKFTNVCDAKVGDKVFSINGVLIITDVQYIEEECEYWNVMTSGKINCFANCVLTSDRYGNMYTIDNNMKYVKDGRIIRPYSDYEAVGILRYWYDNLRLGEVNETVEKTKEYIAKCEGQMLPLPKQS